MPLITLDFSEAKELTEGAYTFRIESWDGPMKTEKGQQRIVCILAVVDGEFAGSKIYHSLMLEGKGAGMTARFLSAVTGENLDVNDLETYELDTDDLIGEEVDGIVALEEYPPESGEKRAKITKFRRS